MRITPEALLVQQNRWPKTGRHILAQYDDVDLLPRFKNVGFKGFAEIAVSD